MRTSSETKKMKSQPLPPLGSRLLAASALFFLSPFIGEFLLGNMPLTYLWLLPILGLMYGLGCIIIRETAVRLKLRWNGILLLCLVYGIIEEAILTQSLFDPNYLGLRLLDYGYIKSPGIGSWWTVYVLGIHLVWSTALPIALIGFLFPKTKDAPFTGKAGFIAVLTVFALFCLQTVLRRKDEEFMASAWQFTGSLIVIVILIISGMLIGNPKRASRVKKGNVPPPILTGLAAFLLSSGFMTMTYFTGRIAALLNVAGMVTFLGSGCILLWIWSLRSGWTTKHGFSVVAGLTFTYIWFGFVQKPSVGTVSLTTDLIGNIVFSCVAVSLLFIAWRKLPIAVS